MRQAMQCAEAKPGRGIGHWKRGQFRPARPSHLLKDPPASSMAASPPDHNLRKPLCRGSPQVHLKDVAAGQPLVNDPKQEADGKRCLRVKDFKRSRASVMTRPLQETKEKQVFTWFARNRPCCAFQQRASYKNARPLESRNNDLPSHTNTKSNIQ